MANKLECYQNNTLTFTCSTPIDATGFTPYLTVKKNISDPSALIEVIGEVSDSSTLFFTVPSTDTSLIAGDYPFDITLENDASIYTIVKDIFRIFDGVRY